MTSKVFQGRAHRERAQPANRSRLGLLEKKKDYVLRARDYHSKQARIKGMKVRAAYRNPNEFYFGMIKSRVDPRSGKVLKPSLGGLENTVDAKYATHEGPKLPTETVLLLKNQDLRQIQELIRVNEAKLTQFQADHYTTFLLQETQKTAKSVNRRHVKFVEDDDELADLIISNQQQIPPETKSEPESLETPAKNVLLEEYEARKHRVEVLKVTEKKLLQERLAAEKGRKRKISQDEHGIPQYKWDQMRKK